MFLASSSGQAISICDDRIHCAESQSHTSSAKTGSAIVSNGGNSLDGPAASSRKRRDQSGSRSRSRGVEPKATDGSEAADDIIVWPKRPPPAPLTGSASLRRPSPVASNIAVNGDNSSLSPAFDLDQPSPLSQDNLPLVVLASKEAPYAGSNAIADSPATHGVRPRPLAPLRSVSDHRYGMFLDPFFNLLSKASQRSPPSTPITPHDDEAPNHPFTPSAGQAAGSYLSPTAQQRGSALTCNTDAVADSSSTSQRKSIVDGYSSDDMVIYVAPGVKGKRATSNSRRRSWSWIGITEGKDLWVDVVSNFGREEAQANSIEMTSIAEDCEGKGRTASARFSPASAQLKSLTAERSGLEAGAASPSTWISEAYMYGDRPLPALQGAHSGFDPSASMSAEWCSSGANYPITGTGPITEPPIVSYAPSLSRFPGYTDRMGRGSQLPATRSPLTHRRQDYLSENLSPQSRSSGVPINHVIDRDKGFDNSISRRAGEPGPTHQLSCESHTPLGDIGESASTPQGGSPKIRTSGSQPPQPSRTTSSPHALRMASVRAAPAVSAIASVGREMLGGDPSIQNDANARMGPGEGFSIGRTDSRAAIHETERKGPDDSDLAIDLTDPALVPNERSGSRPRSRSLLQLAERLSAVTGSVSVFPSLLSNPGEASISSPADKAEALEDARTASLSPSAIINPLILSVTNAEVVSGQATEAASYGSSLRGAHPAHAEPERHDRSHCAVSPRAQEKTRNNAPTHSRGLKSRLSRRKSRGSARALRGEDHPPRNHEESELPAQSGSSTGINTPAHIYQHGRAHSSVSLSSQTPSVVQSLRRDRRSLASLPLQLGAGKLVDHNVALPPNMLSQAETGRISRQRTDTGVSSTLVDEADSAHLHVSDRGQDPGLDQDNSSIYRKNSILRRFIPWASENSSPVRSQGATEASPSTHQPTPSPQPEEIQKILNAIKDPISRSEVLSLRGSRAARFGSAIHRYLDNIPDDDPNFVAILRLLQDLCSTSGELPSDYWLKKVTIEWERCIGKGGEALVCPGVHKSKPIVARKVTLQDHRDWSTEDGKETLALIRREIITHAQLHHPNVIPLLGVVRMTDESPVMILPLMENRSASGYLKGVPVYERSSITYKILLNIAAALAYLHSRQPAVVHGDLHPGNVLIDARGKALLCDFGFSRIRHEVTRTHTRIREGGQTRFLAPELTLGQKEKFRTTQESDIYSLAMTFLALVALASPFAEYDNEYAAMNAAQRGIRPQRPEFSTFPKDTVDQLWCFMERMWDKEPSERPIASDVELFVGGLINGD